MHRFERQPTFANASAPAGAWGSAAPQAWDAGQLAREQALRLYNQQLQRQPAQQQQHNQRPSAPHDLGGMSGYDDGLDAFGWDGPPAHPPMQQYPGAQFSRNPASHQDRQQHSLFARGGFSSELRHKDIGSGDLASSLSLPTSSGTEGRGGSGVAGGGRGPNKRKGGRSRKPPPNESQAMQRCLDVVEQLLEEEDAEPFAEPVDAKALGLHDYHQVVRQPMDLGTIKESLMAEPPSYFSSAEVLKDVQQVWANCRAYNDENDQIIDMCDNMERFFYQAWKEGGLPLPPGAGPTITRVRPTGLKGQQPSVYDSDQQANRGHKRKHAEPQFEEDDDEGYDRGGAMPAQQSVFSLTEGGSVPPHKRRKGINPTSTGTASSHREGPAGPKRKAGPAAPPEPPPEPPVQVQLSAQEQEAEKNDREAVAAWENLQKQRQKAQQVIQAAQDAVKKLNEAQATLDNAHKAAAAQEAAVAAAEALHLWPSNARLVPSSHPNFPPTAPQLLHPDIAKLGSCLFSPPGGIASHALDDSHSMLSSVLDGAAADHVAGLGPNEGDGIGPTAGAAANNADSQQEQNCKHTQQLNGWQGGQPLTGWQRRLQSSMSQHQIQQIVVGKLTNKSLPC